MRLLLEHTAQRIDPDKKSVTTGALRIHLRFTGDQITGRLLGAVRPASSTSPPRAEAVTADTIDGDL